MHPVTSCVVTFHELTLVIFTVDQRAVDVDRFPTSELFHEWVDTVRRKLDFIDFDRRTTATNTTTQLLTAVQVFLYVNTRRRFSVVRRLFQLTSCHAHRITNSPIDVNRTMMRACVVVSSPGLYSQP